MTHFNNISSSFTAILNRIDSGYAMEVRLDSGFVIIIDIAIICILILFFKFVSVKSCISLTRDYEILRFYTHYVGKLLSLNFICVLHYGGVFRSSLQTFLLSQSVKQQKIYPYAVKVSNGNATGALSATKYMDTINDAITMFGSNNGRPNVLVIIPDGDPATGNPYANNCDLKNTLDDASVTVIIVGVGTNFNLDARNAACLVHNEDEKIIHEPDSTSNASSAILLDAVNAVCDFECAHGGTTSEPDLNPFTASRIPLLQRTWI